MRPSWTESASRTPTSLNSVCHMASTSSFSPQIHAVSGGTSLPALNAFNCSSVGRPLGKSFLACSMITIVKGAVLVETVQRSRGIYIYREVNSSSTEFRQEITTISAGYPSVYFIAFSLLAMAIGSSLRFRLSLLDIHPIIAG